jgi:hypothetical protein
MKVGDKFYCNCSCDRLFIIIEDLIDMWEVEDVESGRRDFFTKDSGYIFPETLYNSKLYKALK